MDSKAAQRYTISMVIEEVNQTREERSFEDEPQKTHVHRDQAIRKKEVLETSFYFLLSK